MTTRFMTDDEENVLDPDPGDNHIGHPRPSSDEDLIL